MRFDVARQLRAAPVLFLDCDGVILDANAAKRAGLEAVLREFPEASWEPMRSYWQQSGGVSRYVKFDHFARNVLGLRDAEAESVAARATGLFAAHSRAGYAGMQPLPAALAFARWAGPARLVVISGTDQVELQQVFADKQLLAQFPVVLGSPQGKAAHLREVLAARDAAASDCLFIGDGAGDLAAARELGMPFLFLAAHSGWLSADAAVGEAIAQGAAARVDTWPELLALAGA